MEWQYRVEVFKNPDVAGVANDLNRLGADGWELVEVASTVKTWVNLSGNDLVFVLKKPGRGTFTERPEDRPGYVVT